VLFPREKRADIAEELKEVFPVETTLTNPVEAFKKLVIFVDKWIKKYPSLKAYKNERNTTYFTYLNYPSQVQRMIYYTNWIERLNKDYKRVLKMRGAMPSAESILSLMGAMEKEFKTWLLSEAEVEIFSNGI
jgi:putative transposase